VKRALPAPGRRRSRPDFVSPASPTRDWASATLPESGTAEASITIVNAASELERFADDLTDLADCSTEPNIFYEPWMLLPAIKAFGGKTSFMFVLAFLRHERSAQRLCGFFPLETSYLIGGLPIARLWSYLYFHWCPPLLRAGYEEPCLDAFLAWAASGANRCVLMELGWLPARSGLAQRLRDGIRRQRLQSYICDRGTRALLSRTEEVAAHKPALSGRKIKELNRLQRRLGEKGRVVFERLSDQTALEEWIEGFLGLEAKGWKGRSGTALACSPEQKNFFIDSVASAFKRGQLAMLRLRLEDRAIAYKVNFSSGRGSFAFKIAYDEDYAQFSPGVLLELENIRQFHTSAGPEWMDSCAHPDHFMANRLWRGRRAIESTWIATAGWPSEVLLRLLAGVQRARRWFSPRRRQWLARRTG